MKKRKEWIEEVDRSSSSSNSRRRQEEQRFGHWSSLVLRQNNQPGGETISIEAPAISSSTNDQDTYNNVSCDPLLGILGCEEAPSSEQDFQSFEDPESHYNSIRRSLSSYTAYDYFCIPGFQNVFDCNCGRLLGGSRTVDCIYRNKWCRYGNPDNFCVDAHYEFELTNNDQDIASFQVCLEDLEIRTSGGDGGVPNTKTVTSCYSFDYREPQSCSYSQNGEYCTNSFVNTRGSGVNQKTCCQFNCRNLYDGVLGNSCNKGQYAFRFLAPFLSDFPKCSAASDDDGTTSPSNCFRNPYLCEELSCNCKDVYDTNGSGTIVCPIQYCFGDDPSYNYYYSDTSADNCVSGTKGYDFVNGENMYIEQCLTLVDDNNSNSNSNLTTICYRYDGVDKNGDSSETTCDILINGVSCNVSTCDNSSSSPSFGCQQEFDCSNIPGGRSGLTCNDFPHSSFDKLRTDSPAPSPTSEQESSSQAPSSTTSQPSSIPRSVPPSDNVTPTPSPTISPSVAFSSSPSIREYNDSSSSEEPTKGGTEESSSAVPSDTTFSNSPTMVKDQADDSSYLPSTFPTFMEGSNNGPTSKAQISDAPSMITAMPESRQPSPASAAALTIAPPLGMVWTIIALVYLFAGR